MSGVRTHELLRDFLDMARAASGAARASLLLQLEPAERTTLTLVHGDDGGPAVPELEDEASAWDLLQRAPHRSTRADAVSWLPSSAAGALLVRLSLRDVLARTNARRHDGNERRASPNVATAPAFDGAVWLGLSGNLGAAVAVPRAPDGHGPGSAAAQAIPWLDGPLRVAATLAWSVYQLSRSLHDPVSGLPGRMEFQAYLARALTASAASAQAIGLLLLNPDDFGTINHRYGRNVGDRAVRELADQLLSLVRSTDAVFRYAGAVFGIVLPGADLAQTRAVAEKLRQALTQHGYLDGAAHLTFSMGGVVARAEDIAGDATLDALVRRADMALNMAKLGGGARLLLGGVDDDAQTLGRLDPLGGIFTADSEKDFRNMLLLWDTVGVVSGNETPVAIAGAFVDRLATAFRPARIALYEHGDGDEPRLLAAEVRDLQVSDGHRPAAVVDLDAAASTLMAQARASGRVERLREDAGEDGATGIRHAVPLLARGQPLGCLYLEGGARRGELDSSDLMFLNALCTQLAIALDRATLAARWQQGQVSERKRLEGELRELRQALSQARLVYRSAAMHAAVDSLRRVAASTATVLIIGESGTGKEMLARTLHELSNRRHAPFATVDCGAISANLIEAELFGHVKGAFTGAERASDGRIAQSEGGTLFLDEIGELPLELQAKLLRFVQEREFTPVGAARSRTVDTRIVAATNRRLEVEVAQGRFRADLYYRLQVIVVEAPALRERRDDILPLAHYFLEKFVAQNGTGPRHLTVAAEQRLLQHDWPGNVRELQHCMLRGVLMTDGERIDAADVRLVAEAVPEDGAPGTGSGGERASTQPGHRTAAPLAPPAALASAAPASPWAALASELASQVACAIEQRRQRPVPLGEWLAEDLVLAASRDCADVARRAARRMGVAESTFRRQLGKAMDDHALGLGARTPEWQGVQAHIASIVADLPEDGGADVLERARLLLLGIVRAASVPTPASAAALMGVTLPTYKRWLQDAGA